MTGGRGQSRGCITLGWCGGGVQLWGLLAHTQMGGTVAADRLSRQRGQNQPGAGVCVCVYILRARAEESGASACGAGCSNKGAFLLEPCKSVILAGLGRPRGPSPGPAPPHRRCGRPRARRGSPGSVRSDSRAPGC